MKNYEVLIIGAGMAGMSTALVLGRTLIDCCIISKAPIGDYKPHNFITNDGKPIAQIIESGKNDLAKYSHIDFKNNNVTTVTKIDDLFHVEMENGEKVVGKNIVFSTGSTYNFDAGFAGLKDIFGISAYNCPFCHGYEMQGKEIAVVGTEKDAVPLAKMLSLWTDKIKILTNGSDIDRATSSQFEHITTSIEYLHHDTGMLKEIEFQNGRKIKADFIYMATMGPYIQPGLPSQLGLEMMVNPAVNVHVYPTDSFGRSQMKNVYIIGDLRTGFSTLIGAANEGNVLGMVLVSDISQGK